MNDLYQKFSGFLYTENKEKAVTLILDKLKEIDNIEDLVFIYTQVLGKALNTMVCDEKIKSICIWKEHIRSSIVRTILGNTYPYLIKLRKNIYKTPPVKKAVVICPDGEYHEIGARMAADFFTLANFNTVYVGASTPKEDFVLAINEIKPDVLALSVTNYYNIVSAKKTIDAVRQAATKCPLIVVGGSAFRHNPDISSIGADKLLNSYEDIKKLSEEVGNVTN